MNKKIVTGLVLFSFCLVLLPSSLADNTHKDLKLVHIDTEVEFIDDVKNKNTKEETLSKIHVERGLVRIDTDSHTEFKNKKAKVTFKNLALKNPALLHDGEWDETIEIKRKGLTSFEVTVPTFSEWKIIENTFGGEHNLTSIRTDGVSTVMQKAPGARYIVPANFPNGSTEDESLFGNDLELWSPDKNTTDCVFGSVCHRYDGSGDRVSSSFIDEFNQTSNFTISMWIVKDRTPGFPGQTLISRGTFMNRNYHVYISNEEQLYFQWHNRFGASQLTGANSILPNGTHFVTVTWNGTNNVLYIDGGEVANSTTSEYPTPDESDLFIGYDQQMSNGDFQGIIQCVQMWNLSLTSFQVDALNSSGFCNNGVAFSNNDFTWDMELYTKNQTDISFPEMPSADMGPFVNTTSFQEGTGSMEFDGEDDYIDTQFTQLPDDYTVSFWAFPNKLTTGTGTKGRIVGSNDNNHYIELQSDEITVRANGVLTNDLTLTLNEDAWYHITVTRVDGFHSVYINGSLQVTSTTANANSINIQHIGAGDTFGTPDYFDGFLDNLQIMNYSLSGTEIGDIFQNNRRHNYTPAGNYTSVIYNATDYEGGTLVNVWHNVTINGTSNNLDVYYRGGECTTVTSQPWNSATSLGGNVFGFGSGLQGNCTQLRKSFKGFADYTDSIYSFNISSERYLKPTSNFSNIIGGENTTVDIQGNCTYILNDSDVNRNMTFRWFINGNNTFNETVENLQSGTEASSTLDSSYFVKNDNVNFTCVPHNWIIEGDQNQSTNVVIGNANFAVVSYYPSTLNFTLKTSEEIIMTVTLNDSDGDVVGNWSVNGINENEGLNFTFDSDNYPLETNEVLLSLTDQEFTQTVTWQATLLDAYSDGHLLSSMAALVVFGLLFIASGLFLFIWRRR